MAHDITFQNVENKKEVVCFFGYMEGIFYQKFGVPHFNKGVSGSNESITKNRLEVFEILERISNSSAAKRYPDPNRFPDFYNKIKKSKAAKFKITFS